MHGRPAGRTRARRHAPPAADQAPSCMAMACACMCGGQVQISSTPTLLTLLQSASCCTSTPPIAINPIYTDPSTSIYIIRGQHRRHLSTPTTSHRRRQQHQHGLRQHKRVFLRHRDLHAEQPGLIPGIYFNNYIAVFVHHDLVARVAVYFSFILQFSFLQLLRLLQTSSDNFYAPTKETFSASTSDSGVHGTWWSLSSHVRYWQHRRVPSSPTCSRVWQARQGVPPTSTTSTTSTTSPTSANSTTSTTTSTTRLPFLLLPSSSASLPVKSVVQLVYSFLPSRGRKERERERERHEKT